MYTARMMRLSSLGQGQYQRFATVALAACFVLGIHHGGAAQVMCIGEDGHVEVEPNGDACCAETEPSHVLNGGDQIGAASAANGDDCGACIDIPIVTPGQVAVKSMSASRPLDPSRVAIAIVETKSVVRVNGFPNQQFNQHPPPSSSTNLPLIC
jgi:hypothetical protein